MMQFLVQKEEKKEYAKTDLKNVYHKMRRKREEEHHKSVTIAAVVELQHILCLLHM